MSARSDANGGWKDAIPARWRDGLLGRTRERDDGHAFGLITQAIDPWVPT